MKDLTNHGPLITVEDVTLLNQAAGRIEYLSGKAFGAEEFNGIESDRVLAEKIDALAETITRRLSV